MITRKNHGAPSSTTPGNVGDYYIDIDTGKVYQCVDVTTQGDDLGFVTVYANGGNKNTTYVWKSTGASSWNDLEDKPFYEEEEVVNEPLNITWDGNTEGLESIDTGWGFNLYMLSDVVLTDENVKSATITAGGLSAQVSDIWDNLLVTDEFVSFGPLELGLMVIKKVPSEFIDGVFIPKAGIWVDDAVTSLSFVTEIQQTKTVTHPLDPKFLPDGYPYEEEKVVKEPLNITWDGNTEGLVSVIDMFFKVSDAVLTDEQIKSGTVTIGTEPFSIASMWDEAPEGGISDELVMPCEFVAFVRKAGATYRGAMEFPECGVYLIRYDENTYASSLTTTEPVEHTKTVAHKLDPKFLPDNVGVGVKYVTIGEDDSGNFTSSATYDEIAEWIKAGIDVKCVYGKYVLNLVYSYVISDVSTFLMESPSHAFAGLDINEIQIRSFAIHDNGQIDNNFISLAVNEK